VPSSARVSVPSFAKLNLDLRVLARRPDGFHELRTVFQTISLHDTIGIEFEIAKRNQIEVSSSIDIPDNILVRSAIRVLSTLRLKARVRFTLQKRIPMGAGMGGGSSNAATVLLALPILAGKSLPLTTLHGLAQSLGSDVPFFLYGGTALGLGRGTELYPLPDLPSHHALVVSTGLHVSTAEAYRLLKRPPATALTSLDESPMLREFQTIAWTMHGVRLKHFPLKNDFEDAVFKTHPELAAVARKLRKLGAQPALMTGSGSALFGLFSGAEAARGAAASFPRARAFPVRFLTRRQYAAKWHSALGTAVIPLGL
jgi:4-diphosphocytidyl-2-C-methyl-D-erythritol kinase